MARPPRDEEVARRPRLATAMGCNVFFGLILVALIAILAGLAFLLSPPDAPEPAMTARPERAAQPDGN